MYSQYIDNLLKYGSLSFTIDKLVKDLNVSRSAALKGLSLLSEKGKIVSPLKGFYVVVPVENSSFGCIPAKELVPLIMRHLEADYYVCLLSAAAFYEAEHHKVFTFQVISDKKIKSQMQFGQVKIDFIRKKNIKDLPIRDFVVKTGYLKVSSPEQTVLDLFQYYRKSGGINHIATTLAELVSFIDIHKLIELAEQTDQIFHLQRFAFVLEKIEIMEGDEFQEEMLNNLKVYLTTLEADYVKLVPYKPMKGCFRSEKWKIIENTDFESDI